VFLKFKKINHAIAAASDRGTVVTLATTNSKLTTQLEASRAYIKKFKEEITDLKAKMKPEWQSQRPAKTTSNDNYCWSHCYQFYKDHSSATCKAHKCGHKKKAMKSNSRAESSGDIMMWRGWRDIYVPKCQVLILFIRNVLVVHFTG
jgi:protease II